MNVIRLLAGLLLAIHAPQLMAADIHVVSTVGVRGLLEHARPEFERQSGLRLQISYGTANVLKRDIEAGTSFDVVVLPRPIIDDLTAQGRAAVGTAVNFAKTGMGVLAPAGAPKPPVGTPELLKATLLSAPAIAFTKEGQSGIAARHTFETLGIAERLKERIYEDTRPAGGVLAVADGKAPLGLALLSEIAAGERVELVGPLPAELQSYVVFAAAAGTGAPEVSRALIGFLAGTSLERQLRASGLERPRDAPTPGR